MADRVVNLQPNDRYAFRVTVELGDVSVRLRLRWMERVLLWTLLMETPAGAVLTMQAPARAGGIVAFDPTAEGAPPGELRWQGRDTETSEELGDGLFLVWTEP